MNGQVRLLLAAVFVGFASLGLSLTGCGDSSAEPCQDNNDCLSNEVCTATGDCVAWGADAGDEADGTGGASIARVEVSPAEAEVGVGLTMQLEADAVGADGASMPAALFDWESSDEEVVTVDGRGVIKAVGLGRATVTARPVDAPEVSGSAVITVVEGDIASVIVDPDPLVVIRGTTERAEATPYNAAVEPVEASAPVWRVEDEEIAAVDAEGNVEGISVGTTRLIANIEGVEGHTTLEVVPVPVDRIEISPQEPTVADGETVQLEAVGYDGQGNVLEGRAVTWESDDVSVAKVNEEGVVTGVSVGSATIRAQMGLVSAHVISTVVEANRAPLARDHTVSIEEDASVELTLGANDADGDDLTFAIASEPAHGTLGTLDTSTGKLVYTPDTDYVGTDSFTFTASDGETISSEGTVTLRIGGVNDVPVPQDDSATTDEDTSVVIDVLANDADPENDDLTLSLADPPSDGSVALSNNAIEYTPDEDFNGTDTFTYGVSDGSAGQVEATVTVQVAPVNDAPQANDDTAQTDQDQPVSIEVLANDSDVDGDTLSVASTTASAESASISVASDGTLTYTPPAGFAGVDTFEYTVSDGPATTTAAVTVTVNDVNDAPSAADDTAVVDEDASVDIDVLQNDADADNDMLSVASTTSPTNGAVSVSGATVTYTPDADYHGSDSFEYTVSDGTTSATATVTVTVNALNDAPVAQDDTASAGVDATVTVDVLSNDGDADAADTLSISSVNTTASAGSVSLNADGTLTYTAPSSAGEDSFVYTVSDGNGGTDTATVTVTVQ